MIDLATLIAHVESDNNQYAMRFEPHVYQRTSEGKYALAVAAAREVNRCSRATATVIVSTSWGLYQIMGFNLYAPALGLKYPICEYTALPGVQTTMFHTFVSELGFDLRRPSEAMDDWMLKFARAYNGPGAPTEYVQRMKQVLARLVG